MNRRTNKKEIEDLLNKIRKEIPNVVLRTSLIVGFPGETQEDFEELSEFIKMANLTNWEHLCIQKKMEHQQLDCQSK